MQLKFKIIMKNYITILLLTIGFASNAQYYSITFVNVPQENISEFVRLETTYWSKVAKHNIENGKQLNWGLVSRVGGGSDSWNFAFVNVYEKIEQMTDGSVWDPKSILGIDPQDITTGHLVEGQAISHWSVQTSIDGSGGASVWNFARPNNVGAFIQENIDLWGPAFKKNMGGRTNWGVGRRINNIQSQWSTVMTWDSFETVADALKFMNGEFAQPQVSNSNMAEIAPNGFTSRIIVTPVMWAVE